MRLLQAISLGDAIASGDAVLLHVTLLAMPAVAVRYWLEGHFSVMPPAAGAAVAVHQHKLFVCPSLLSHPCRCSPNFAAFSYV